nr:aldehyde dehydrogenase mitochondrial [Hymenolepis microstoma]
MQRPTIRFTKLFINGEFVKSASGDVFAVINPATEEDVCKVSEGGAVDIDAAVQAARTAFRRDSVWRTMDASERGRLLYCLADALQQHSEEFASLEALDTGKPLESARGDVDFAVSTLRYFAGYADKFHGQVIPCNGDVVCYTRREPVGVVGAIIPWNYPLDLIVQKVAPALAMGCCLVVKPSEETPLSALLLAHFISQVGKLHFGNYFFSH